MQRMNGNQQHHTYGMYECNVLNTITLNTAYELTTAYTTVTLNKKWIFNVMIVKIIHLIYAYAHYIPDKKHKLKTSTVNP